MFRSAYIRMTIWYVAILMGLSLAFSVWVYTEAMNEVRVGLTGPIAMKIQDRFGVISSRDLEVAIQQQYVSSQGRILGNLFFLNMVVLGVGTALSYWLARQTMQPIEKAVESQNRFTADASHELRTPLASMKTELEVALRDPNLSKAEMRELLQSSLEETNHMSDLTQGLLTLARSGEALQLSPLATRASVSEVCKRLQPLAEAKGITLQKDLVKLKVIAEKKSFETVVGILLDNAIKYSHHGAIVTVVTARKDGFGLISIADTGAGIAPADLPHIFDRFYRADSSRTKGSAGGHGLGLSIAQKMTAAMHGEIIAQSELGKGSTFILRLPLAVA